MPLTKSDARTAKPRKKNYKLFDEGGLFLLIRASGIKSWQYQYRFARVDQTLTFGRFPDISVKKARKRRNKARALINAGFNPKFQMAAKYAMEIDEDTGAPVKKKRQLRYHNSTFKEVASAWYDSNEKAWSDSHALRVHYRLKFDLYPALGSVPISEIDAAMVLKVLRSIEARGAMETAKRVKQYVVAIFNRAKAENLVTRRTLYSLKELGPALERNPPPGFRPSLRRVHELLEFQEAIDSSTAKPLLKLASRLLALTVPSLRVLRQAHWKEFEGISWDDPLGHSPTALWRVPAEHFKLDPAKKTNPAYDHFIPLPRQAVEVLHAIRTISGESHLLFPRKRGAQKPLGSDVYSVLYRNVREGAYRGKMVPHGWRSAFSTVMNERAANLDRDKDRIIIDLMLGHVPHSLSPSEFAYNRARYMEPRRRLAQVWADTITQGLLSPASLLQVERARQSRRAMATSSLTESLASASM